MGIVNIFLFIASFLLMAFYGKYARFAMSKSICLSKLSLRLGHLVLALLCCLSSELFLALNTVVDVRNIKILTLSILLIPFTLGYLWGWKEEQYYKRMQPMVNLPSDS
jgi:hypothetical protein